MKHVAQGPGPQARQSRWVRARAIAGQTLIWLVTFLAAAPLFEAGIGKFTHHEGWVYWFGRWGYPAWFVTVIGVTEAGLAVAMLVPELAAWAAGGLITVMVGAVWTVTTNETDLSWFDPVFAMAVLTIVIVARWRRRGVPRFVRRHA